MLFHRKEKGAWITKHSPPIGSWGESGDDPKERPYYIDDWPNGWRDVGDCDEVSRSIGHLGWYESADHDGHRVIRGRVLQLPARDGKPVYVPGVYGTDYAGVTLYPLLRTDDKIGCAHSADGLAESAAEQMRDHDAAYCAEVMIESHEEEIENLRGEIKALIRDLRMTRQRLPRSVCDVLKEALRKRLRNISGLRTEICHLRENPYSAFET